MKNMNKKREANIELLRVLAMLMVITLHALGHGGILDSYKNSGGEYEYYFFQFLFILNRVSVNCFVLITGYLMVKSKFNFLRIINLIIQIEFYSIFCSLAAKFIFHKSIGMKELLFTIFPLTSNRYWFMTCYAILLILIPLFNKFILSIGKKQLVKVNLFLIVLFSVIPTIFYWSRRVLGNGYTFTWFVVLYFAGAYIGLYGCSLKKNWSFWLYFIFSGMGYILHMIIMSVSGMFGYSGGEMIFYTYNNVICFLAALFLFLTFINMNITLGIWSRIAKLGRYSLGAYLCSDNEIIRKFIWEMAGLGSITRQGLMPMLLYLVCVVFILYLSGCFMEWCRVKVMRNIGIIKRLDNVKKEFEIFQIKVNEKIKKNEQKQSM